MHTQGLGMEEELHLSTAVPCPGFGGKALRQWPGAPAAPGEASAPPA